MGRLFLRKGQGEMGEPIANVIHASTDLQIGIFVKVQAKPRPFMTLSYWPLSLSCPQSEGRRDLYPLSPEGKKNSNSDWMIYWAACGRRGP